jgi:branched-chain amino acid transport system substrate-binding protein
MMHIKISTRWLLLLGLIFTTCLVRAQETIKIGALYPLSGQVAKSGEDTLNAIRLATDIINGNYKGWRQD